MRFFILFILLVAALLSLADTADSAECPASPQTCEPVSSVPATPEGTVPSTVPSPREELPVTGVGSDVLLVWGVAAMLVGGTIMYVDTRR